MNPPFIRCFTLKRFKMFALKICILQVNSYIPTRIIKCVYLDAEIMFPITVAV